MHQYSSAIHHAVRYVRDHVTGAERDIGRDDLYQEARLLVWQNWATWEREAHTNLAAYAKARLRYMLANYARSVLAADGAYGKSPDDRWKRHAHVVRAGPEALASIAAKAENEGNGFTGLAPGDQDNIAGVASPRPVHRPTPARDDLNVGMQAPRSIRWARLFIDAYPYAARAFWAIDDRVRPATQSKAAFARRIEEAKATLRDRFAAEIAATDYAEARRDEARLLDAMFGQAA